LSDEKNAARVETVERRFERAGGGGNDVWGGRGVAVEVEVEAVDVDNADVTVVLSEEGGGEACRRGAGGTKEEVTVTEEVTVLMSFRGFSELRERRSFFTARSCVE